MEGGATSADSGVLLKALGRRLEQRPDPSGEKHQRESAVSSPLPPPPSMSSSHTPETALPPLPNPGEKGPTQVKAQQANPGSQAAASQETETAETEVAEQGTVVLGDTGEAGGCAERQAASSRVWNLDQVLQEAI